MPHLSKDVETYETPSNFDFQAPGGDEGGESFLVYYQTVAPPRARAWITRRLERRRVQNKDRIRRDRAGMTAYEVSHRKSLRVEMIVE